MKNKNIEIEYIKHLIKKVELRIAEINDAILLKKEEIDYMNKHMEDHKRDMDHLEKNAMRETVNNYTLQGNHSIETKNRLIRLKNIGYFGRIDFEPTNSKKIKNIYVGVHNFQDKDTNINLVYDWRAPISSLFYDFELGNANYKNKNGEIEGEISLKRQFRIRNGIIEYMFDTNISIHDEILQKELNQASSSKMKNIVATIQKEQNSIIRNEEAKHLIIQGVAGSGKTSIALHRIAFLLYRFKDNISSEDILIISPNKIFANYISNVLPELGEETVAEISMEDIANELLDYQINFQSFSEQVAELLEKNDIKHIERIKFKTSIEFLNKIDEYIAYLENTGFNVVDIFVKNKPVPAWFIKESFQRYSRLPILKRFNEVVNDIVNNIYKYYKIEIQYKDRTDLHNTIRKMFPSYNPRVLYKNFHQWLDKAEFLKLKKGNSYEWCDVFAYIYFKSKLEGLKTKNSIKHLVIDEMQDYSLVQYRVLNILYPCKKTILGDINQSVNPFSCSDIKTIQNAFGNSENIKITKSYRSTFEITEFSKKINSDIEVQAIERHGSIPQIIKLSNTEDEVLEIQKSIKNFKNLNFNSLGIICKTQTEAKYLYEKLKTNNDILLLTPSSTNFNTGITIMSAHLSKGLEFDQVIIPNCNSANYKTPIDKQMLYIACTRAMHLLTLTYNGRLSNYINY